MDGDHCTKDYKDEDGGTIIHLFFCQLFVDCVRISIVSAICASISNAPVCFSHSHLFIQNSWS
jgi:hypothetical protein